MPNKIAVSTAFVISILHMYAIRIFIIIRITKEFFFFNAMKHFYNQIKQNFIPSPFHTQKEIIILQKNA